MNLNSITNKILSIGKSILKYWKDQTKSQKTRIVVIASIIVIGSATLVITLNHTTYAVLYTNLSAKDAGDILAKLTEMKIDGKAQGADTILVPENEVSMVRMELASAGYPTSSANLDILAKGTGFGVTEEDKAIYRKYQLQADLQNSIKQLSSIADARVSLYIPAESSFVIDNSSSEATAAALITLKPGNKLTAGNVKAISELIQKSVSGLTAENVSIIDSDMNVLSGDEDATGLTQGSRESTEEQVSDRLRKQVISLLQPIFGIDNVGAQVNVALNFDESTIDTIKFEPMENATTGIIKTIDSIREVTKNAAGNTTDATAAATYPVTDTADSVYQSNTEKITYEINTIKEHLVKAKGSISKLSVSVLINKTSTNGADYTQNVKNLVGTAVGVSPDYITVESLPFTKSENEADALKAYEAANSKAEQWQLIKSLAYVFGGLLAFIILLVTITKRKHKSKEEEFEENFPSLFSKDSKEMRENRANNDSKREIDFKIDDATNTKREIYEVEKSEKALIEKYVESNPELVVSIIRSWLAEDEG